MEALMDKMRQKWITQGYGWKEKHENVEVSGHGAKRKQKKTR